MSCWISWSTRTAGSGAGRASACSPQSYGVGADVLASRDGGKRFPDARAAFAHVQSERGDLDQYRHIVQAGRRLRDHGAAGGMPDETAGPSNRVDRGAAASVEPSSRRTASEFQPVHRAVVAAHIPRPVHNACSPLTSWPDVI